MKARHLVVGTAVAGIATFAATGVDAHQPALQLTCSHVRAEMFLYPAGSTYTLTVDGVAHSLNGAGYYDASLTPTLNHTATFRITSSDGQGNFDQTLTRDNCVPSTTTAAPTTTTTTTVAATTTTTEETTSSPPTSSSTTTGPSTSTAPSTTAPSTPTSSPATSGPPPSQPSVPPSTPSSEPCLTSSTNSDGATSSSTGCEPTTSTLSPRTTPPTTSAPSSLSSLPSTGSSDAVPFVAAGLAALIGGSALVFVARRRRPS